MKEILNLEIDRLNNPHHFVPADFYDVPIFLKTSFNENEPVVCRLEEAIDSFLRTRMDVLVLGDVVVERG